MDTVQHGEEQAVNPEDSVGCGPDACGAGKPRVNRHLAAYRLAASQRVERVFPMVGESHRVSPTFSERLHFNGWVKTQLDRRNIRPIPCPGLDQ